VDRSTQTGEPGPSSPLARLVAPPVCRDNQTGAAVVVLYAGLAPGLIGIFQMDIRVPMNTRQFFGGGCRFPDDTSVIGFDTSIGFYMPTTGPM
jgi:hypothetical protein